MLYINKLLQSVYSMYNTHSHIHKFANTQYTIFTQCLNIDLQNIETFKLNEQKKLGAVPNMDNFLELQSNNIK